MARVPETVAFAQTEQRDIDIAATPEGRFVLTYLLASRDLLKPALRDLTNISPDLLVAKGGRPHNPERNIDAVGTEIAHELIRTGETMPNAWMRTEESTDWQPLGSGQSKPDQGERFIVLDPMDMTSAIPRLNRVQTTGIAVYGRDGDLRSLGIMSLVDDDFLFVEADGTGGLRVYPPARVIPESAPENPLRVAAKVRRINGLKQLPLLTEGGIWVMDCDSGYATLGLRRGTVDTVIDHVRGSVWYEVVLWVRAAQALGLPVSDANGNPIDITDVMKKMIARHEGDTYRVPFVMSRTPQIHERVLRELRPHP